MAKGINRSNQARTKGRARSERAIRDWNAARSTYYQGKVKKRRRIPEPLSRAKKRKKRFLSFGGKRSWGELFASARLRVEDGLYSPNRFARVGYWALYGLGWLVVIVGGAGYCAACLAGPIVVAALVAMAQTPRSNAIDYGRSTGPDVALMTLVVIAGYLVTLPLLYMGPLHLGRIFYYGFKFAFCPGRKETWGKLRFELRRAKEKWLAWLDYMIVNTWRRIIYGRSAPSEGEALDWS